MSALWRAAWLVASQDTRDELAELAHLGDRITVGLGGAATSPTITGRSSGEAVGAWVDRFDAAAAVVGAMPVSVLWAGVSGFDPRSDVVVRELAIGDAPSWAQVLATARTRRMSRELAAALDIDSSRGRGLDAGSDDQQTQSRYHRAWWASRLARLPALAAGDPAPPLPGQTTPARIVPPGDGPGLGALAAAIALALALSRRRRPR